MYTNEQIREIAGRLAALGVSDSRFAWSSRLLGDETLVVVQDGGERRVTVRELYDTFRDSMYFELALQLWTSCWALYGDELFGRARESMSMLCDALDALKGVEETLGDLCDGTEGLNEMQKDAAALSSELESLVAQVRKTLK